MSHNTFGHLFRVTTWGESHGKAIGCVVDGCPPGLAITEEFVQGFLDKRRPGTSRFVTQRQEPDAVRILSGVFEDDRTDGQVTTGTPISMMIENVDQRSVGRLVLGNEVSLRGAVVQIGPHKIGETFDWAETENNPFWCPCAETAKKWEEFLDETRKAGSSAGAIIEVHADGVPAGWGAPIYGKLDAELAGALMSINAVKGVNDGARFLSNNNGGVAGGISTGQTVVARIAIKPTSSILNEVQSITKDGENVDVRTKGRHDPCVGIRAVPVAEAMMACVLADAKLRHRGQMG